jgi:O-antigen/teichoic acid export membrane protein
MRSPSRLMASGASIAVAIAVMNLATYASTVLAARLLGPREYGGFAAFTGLLLVLGVLMLGLQTAGARRVASDPDRVGQIEGMLLRVTYRCAWVLLGVCALLTPVFDLVLDLRSWVTAALIALVVWPMTAVGGVAGILQGERRWPPLALLYLGMGLSRLAATLLLLWQPTETVAAFSMLVGFVVPALIGWWALRSGADRRAPTGSGDHSASFVLREVATNSHVLLAFLALSNADVILVRGVLDGHDAGLYAGGLILVKSLLFLPQFVIVVAFPSLSTTEARRTALTRSVALVMGLGAVGTLAAWVLSGVALVFVGGREYAEIQDQLWLFAVLGTVLSTIQLLIYSVVARQSRRTVYLVWTALAALALGVSQATTVTETLIAVTAVDTVLLVVLLAISWWRLRGDDQERAAQEATASSASSTSSEAPESSAPVSTRGQ